MSQFFFFKSIQSVSYVWMIPVKSEKIQPNLITPARLSCKDPIPGDNYKSALVCVCLFINERGSRDIHLPLADLNTGWHCSSSPMPPTEQWPRHPLFWEVEQAEEPGGLVWILENIPTNPGRIYSWRDELRLTGARSPAQTQLYPTLVWGDMET